MNFIIKIYEAIFYQPVFSFLSFLVNTLKDFGFALLFLTFFMRLILFPITLQMLKNEKKLKSVQEKIAKLPKEKQGEELMKICREEKINPFFQFFFLIIQAPFFLSISQALMNLSLSSSPTFFLKVIDLSKAKLIFPFFTFLLMIFTPSTPKNSDNFFLYFFALFTFFFLLRLPPLISSYISFVYFFSIIERLIFLKKYG